jgi:hypothetical protein
MGGACGRQRVKAGILQQNPNEIDELVIGREADHRHMREPSNNVPLRNLLLIGRTGEPTNEIRPLPFFLRQWRVQSGNGSPILKPGSLW